MKNKTAALVAACAMYAAVARADSDKLPTTFDSFAADFHKAAVRGGLRESLTKADCLPGSADKRTVCNYKVGEIAIVMVQSEKGSTDVTTTTTICTPKNNLDSAKCLQLYLSELAFLAPDLSDDKRGHIVKFLLEGLQIGHESRVVTDDSKFTLQNVAPMGLWFHIQAADAEGTDFDLIAMRAESPTVPPGADMPVTRSMSQQTSGTAPTMRRHHALRATGARGISQEMQCKISGD